MMFRSDPNELRWIRRRGNTGGYSVIAYDENYHQDKPNSDNVEPWAIEENCALHICIADYYTKNKDLGVLVLKQGDVIDDDEE